MAMVVVDNSSLQADSQPKSGGFVWGSAATWRCSTFIKWTDWTLAMTLWSWWWPCGHDDSTINIVLNIIIIIIFNNNNYYYCIISCLTDRDDQRVCAAQFLRESLSLRDNVGRYGRLTVLNRTKLAVL